MTERLPIDTPARPEPWLRGPVAGVPSLLQPCAHALLQVIEDVPPHVVDLTPAQLWARPGGAASVGFHLAHLPASLDRLLTYARGDMLSPDQRTALAAERTIHDDQPSLDNLLGTFRNTLTAGIAWLREIDPGSLLEPRAVGRARLPSTVLGLLFHAAEHSARHAGQIITLSRVVRG